MTYLYIYCLLNGGILLEEVDFLTTDTQPQQRPPTASENPGSGCQKEWSELMIAYWIFLTPTVYYNCEWGLS